MEQEQKLVMVSKVTLGSGKVVLLREMKIKHQELAAMAAAPKAAGDQVMLALLMQKELVKILVVQVDGKVMRSVDLEDLDKVFTMGEYGQILQVVRQFMGDAADLGKFQIETVSSGGN